MLPVRSRMVPGSVSVPLRLGREAVIHQKFAEAAGILWRCIWTGWMWFWSAVGLCVTAMGVWSQSWYLPTYGVLLTAGLVALIRIGILVGSAVRERAQAHLRSQE